MIALLLALQAAPPPPIDAPPIPTPARTYSCEMKAPDGSRFRIVGGFDAVQVGPSPTYGIVQAKGRITEGPNGRYVGEYDGGYNYGEPRMFNFAQVSSEYVTKFSYSLLNGQPGGLLTITRQKQTRRAPIEAIGVGYCVEKLNRPEQ